MLCEECQERPMWIKKHALCQRCYFRRYMRERRGSKKGGMSRAPRLAGGRLHDRACELLGGQCVLCEEQDMSRLHLRSAQYFGWRERRLWALCVKMSRRKQVFQLLCERCIRDIQEDCA